MSSSDQPNRQSGSRTRGFAAALLASLCILGIACSSAADEGSSTSSEAPRNARQAASADLAGDVPQQEIIEIEPAAAPSEAARTEAMEFRDEVLASVAAAGWTDVETARADGFRPMPLDDTHWYHPGYVSDGKLFDPTAPEFLVVVGDDVVGTMFLAAGPSLDQPDPPGAPYMKWHYHRWSEEVCLEEGMVITGMPSAGTCPAGSVLTDVSPLMAHVWLIELDDPFAAEMDAHRHH